MEPRKLEITRLNEDFFYIKVISPRGGYSDSKGNLQEVITELKKLNYLYEPN